MKYTKLFNNHSEYEAYVGGTSFITPNVSWCIQDEEAHCTPSSITPDYSSKYLTFTATESGTFRFSGNSINYSLDNGSTWTSLASDTNSPTVNAGNKIMWKAELSPKTNIGIGKFSSSANFIVEGNTMSLLYGDNFKEQTNLSGKTYALNGLFNGCTKLTSAENMILPATTLANCCYQRMFNGCTSLTTAPELPATTMATSAYTYMFSGCTSLTIAPELPATTLANYCYYSMFDSCSGLTTAPVLSATTMAQSCYQNMFSNCKSLRTPPELPAMTLAVSCYNTMFNGCTNLETTPVLSATTLYQRSYKQLFRECSKITSITCLATDLNAHECTLNWVYGVQTTSGTFTKAASMTGWTTGVNGIPTNWTVVNEGGITVEDPIITCDGEYVTITCETPSVDLYYRLNESGNYSAYTTQIELTANTVVEAYAELDDVRSNTIKQTCQYIESVDTPSITCNGEYVTITCNTAGASIYYKLDDAVNYTSYSTPFNITADTTVYAYATLGSKSSTTVTETCIYNPSSHDYSLDYLTFDVLTNGTIMWVQKGTVAKTISYSTNDGQSWTSITATTAGTPINVSAGDKVLFKGSNDQYASSKNNCSLFSGGTATYNAEGNIMSLISGDSFTQATAFTKTWVFHSLFDHANVVSAENLIMPVTTLTDDCYRAMFANATSLTVAPALPATTVSKECYWYMFENCALITKAPDLPAETLGIGSYGHMFTGCTSLSYIKCLATNISASASTTEWVLSVSPTGTFVKDANMTSWTTGATGIPTGWVVKDADALAEPTISFDGFNTITLSCETTGATIYYKLNQTGNYSAYTTAITITADTVVEAYSEKSGETSNTVSQTCTYISDIPFEYSNRNLNEWRYTNDSINVTVPYSVNAIDGHSSHYKTDGDSPKLPFSFETNVGLKEAQPTYLWFEHADQSADIYVDNTLVETHYGGYNAFFSDISNYVHSGTNNIKVSLRNKQRSDLAPCAGDFNFNATLGYVKLFTSPYLPSKEYGYDGFHVTSQFEYTTTANTTASTATITVRTSIPTGATVNLIIKSGNTNIYSATSASTGEEMIFTTPSLTGSNLHLWGGMDDPFLYDITLEIYHGQDLYHRYTRGYGLRFYEYVINDTVKYGTVGNPYTGFLLNGQPYLLRGVCMHNDKENKANALTSADIAADFNIIRELGCNFIRLAHYPHPKEVYDLCDRYGIVVQTEVPWVNQSSSGQPEAYYTRLEGQYDDMVKQHYNHPCILFWGLANEITPSTTSFTKSKIEQYTAQIKALDSERMVGFVMSHSYNSPSSFGTPNVDWFGCNIYVGWYVDKTSNDPTNQLNTRKNNFITNANKPFAFSEYGCGGTQRCHSDDPQTTTTKGTNQPRHDIEYEMWIHEGHIAAIRNFPQLLFTAQWQLFDIAVYNRQEGYTICLDGENTSTDDNLKYLNNKGLVERDHVTKKDVFYIYKAEWSDEKFVHICGKDYTKKANRVIKCYTNQTTEFALKVNGTTVETKAATDNILTFTAYTFNSGDVVTVESGNISDTFTFE